MESTEPKLEDILKFYLDHKDSNSSPLLNNHTVVSFRSNDSSTISTSASDSLEIFSSTQTETDSDVNSPEDEKKRGRKTSKNERECLPSSKRVKNN